MKDFLPSLNIYHENEICASPQGFFHLLFPCSVKIPVYLCPFKEPTLPDSPLELFLGDEAVIDTILLSRSGRSTRVAYRDLYSGDHPDRLAGQGCFSCTAGGAKDDEERVMER